MAEIITKDCKEYHIWDKVNGVWNRLFFKTNAKSVEADDGKELQTKVGAINGISSSSTATDENIAASIGYVNQELTELNTNLKKCIPVPDYSNRTTIIQSTNTSITLEEDCFIGAYLTGSGSVVINGISHFYTTNSIITFPPTLCLKGDVIETTYFTSGSSVHKFPIRYKVTD